MEENSLVGTKEEITDLFTPEVYTAKEKDVDRFVFHKGKLLKFNFEGSITCIRVTRIDRKNQRMWGVHIQPMLYHTAMGHYRHNIDVTEEAIQEHGGAWCSDCEVLVSEPSTEDGEVKAAERQERSLADGTEVPE